MYGGGADTITSTISTFFLYMILHPEIQEKAQHEILEIVGHDRAPTIKDRKRLPYIEAIVKECLRIAPVAPLGVPHCVREEDSYLGYRIPKGSIVYANIWRILQDPRIYDDPHSFQPERHLQPRFENDPAAKRSHDPSTYAFGFGRRVCPGQQLAQTTIFLCFARTLACFDVKKVEGQEIPVVDCTTGAFSHPVEFEYELTPRLAKECR